MKKWMAEDWQFEVTVTDGFAEDCRLGLERATNSRLNTGVLRTFVPARWRRFLHGARSSGAAGILRIGDAGKNMKWIWHVPVTISGFI